MHPISRRLRRIASQDIIEQIVGRHGGVHFPKIVHKENGSGERSHPEARQHGDEMWLYPKFWDHTPDIQEFILLHEAGHYALSKKSLKWLVAKADELGVDVWNDLPYASPNMDEAFADCFATYHLNRRELEDRYPKWLQLVKAAL